VVVQFDSAESTIHATTVTNIARQRRIVISQRLWRWFPRRSDSSTASKIADSSAIAGVSPPSPFVAEQDRKAARYSRLETIAACSVIAGIVAEDWDNFGKFFTQLGWATGRVAIGGFAVAAGIALEVWFASRVSSAERKIRDWYAVRVAELNLKAEQERLARVKIEKSLAPRHLTTEQGRRVSEKLRQFAGTRANFFIVTGDSETVDVANEIHAAMINEDAARWIVTVGSGHDSSVITSGIIVELWPDFDSVTEAAAQCLTDALLAEDLDVVFYQRTNLASAIFGQSRTDPAAKIRVVISKKP
jgi:hypothetical protein